jgi:acetyltransferase
VLANLRAGGFAGRIIPINHHAATVQGLPARPSIAEVEEPVDLAVVTTPPAGVLAALRDCAAKGVGAAVVITAGFRESGAEGRTREAELRSWLRKRPLRVLGPNCLGWIRPSARLNATFAPGMPDPGGIAFISHSGALAVAILDWARERRTGFSLFASLGNQADLTEADLLEAVAADEETRVVVAYIEGVADGRRFLDVLSRAASAKPVVVLKAGRTEEGARAVASHTGALAGSDRAFDAAVRQAGAVRVETVEELFALARGLGCQPLPRGRRLVVLTNGGGLGIVATDAARAAGLQVRPLPEPVSERLRAALPPTASLGNPIDLVGDADAARYSHALNAWGGDAADAALVVLTAQATTDAAGVARAVVGAVRGWPIPVAAAMVGGARVAPGTRVLEDAGIPCYSFPEPAVRTLAGMALLGERRRAPAAPARIPVDLAAARGRVEALARGAGTPGLAELLPLLGAYGIPCLPAEPAATPEEAARAAGRHGVPVALKVRSPEISHKTDVGGVRLGVEPAAVAVEARALLARVRAARPGARLDGLLVQPMAPRGVELLLGMTRDPQSGPLVLVGLGGIYVEVLGDTAARLAPIGPGDAEAMLAELRMAPALAGFRGLPAVDRAALVGVMCRFAQLVADHPRSLEIELNPLVATPDAVIAVDARARLAAADPDAGGG